MTDSLRQPQPYPTLFEYNLDGYAALEAVIAASGYHNMLQAVASLTVFSHPDTVRHTGCQPVIRVIRHAAKRGSVLEVDGKLVGLDDNKAPTDIFLWCNGIVRRPRDIQFNHVYADSQDPESYGCLANLCITPSFLAKLTDTNPTVKALLQYRAFDLYGWHPGRLTPPPMPEAYNHLTWAPCLPPVEDPKRTFLAFMSRRPKDRTTLFAARLGTVFDAVLGT